MIARSDLARALLCAAVMVSLALSACASRTRLPLPLPPTALTATSDDAFASPPEATPATGLPEAPVFETRRDMNPRGFVFLPVLNRVANEVLKQLL